MSPQTELRDSERNSHYHWISYVHSKSNRLILLGEFLNMPKRGEHSNCPPKGNFVEEEEENHITFKVKAKREAHRPHII